MSLRSSVGWPSSSSGGMYGIVPASPPIGMASLELVTASLTLDGTRRARPKSSTFARPSALTTTFGVLRSR